MQHWSGMSVVARGALAGLLLAGAGVAQAAEPSPTAAEPAPADGRWPIEAGTPLADALRAYARLTGYDVVFAEEVVEGKSSSAIGADATTYLALDQLLDGTGLAPRFTRRDAFIVEAVAQREETADLLLERIEVVTTPQDIREAEYRWYGEKLLEVSLAALRGSRELGMQSYNFTLYVWLSNEGQVIDLEGRGSGGDVAALARAQDVLTGLFVGTPPPAHMPQPVGLRIVAQ